MVASETTLSDSLVRQVMQRLRDAGLVAESPRRGVAESPAAARTALREHMPACGAREGRVELVELGTDADLASGYVPTGTAWRAVLTTNGRVLLYAVRPVTLTRRERQVAELAAAGMTSKQIARQLCIAKRTVDAHLQAAYAKTGTGTRIRLANWLRA
jgi:DNA-binding CsgD family transcriptional regulator